MRLHDCTVVPIIHLSRVCLSSYRRNN